MAVATVNYSTSGIGFVYWGQGSMDGKVSSFRANRNRQTFDILVDIGGGEGGGTPRPDYPEPIVSPLFRR